MRKAKILATLGPASRSPDTIRAMLQAGLNAVRINMSHGTQDEHSESIRTARSIAGNLGLPLAVLVDLSGPKIRTRRLKNGTGVQLNEGQPFTITTREIEGTGEIVGTNFAELPRSVSPGSRVLIDDGAIELVVESTTDTDVVTRVRVGGTLLERKGINLPHTPLPIPSLTEKDRDDLEWAMLQNVDYIALSFVRTAADCTEVKDLIKKLNKRHLGRALLVAKIEKAEAIENLDAIIQATDGVMVARGDLGVETSVELVPVYQKRIIEEAVAHDRFVITATQMLQSMIQSPTPTRAEASDVANAVWDGSDAVMLSAETASGKYPVESIATMARIIDAAESVRADELPVPVKVSLPATGRTSQALCKAAVNAASEMRTEKVAVFTESGLMARRLSSFRSGLQTFALTTSREARDQLALMWGVKPFFHEQLEMGSDARFDGDATNLDLIGSQEDKTGELMKVGEGTLIDAGAVERGETIIMMAGRLSGHGLSSSVVVWTIGEEVPRR